MTDLLLTLSQRRAILFDFDDTLVATKSSRKLLFRRFLQLIVDLPEGALDEVWGRPMHEMLDRLAPGIDHRRLLETYATIMELGPPVPLLPGAEATVRCLAKRGIPLMILTSSAHRLVESDLARHDLLSLFELIVSSDGLPWAKPDRRAMGPILDWLSERDIQLADTIMLGDSLSDFEFARSAGVPFLAITSGSTDRVMFQSAGCKDIVESLEAIGRAACGSG